MADIRISKLLRQFNIGLDDLVDFLHKQGVDVDANPNAKVSDEHLPALMKQFGKDLEMKQAADKVEVKITEILEKSGRRQPKEEPEEEEPERETIIKSNTFINSRKEAPQPAPVKPAEPAPEPEKPAPEPEKPVEPEPQPEPEKPAPEPEKPVEPEPQPEPEKPAPEPEKPAEPEPQPEPEKPAPEPEKPVEPEPQPEPEQPAPEPEKPAATEAPATDDAPALKVVGKIDLSQFDRKPAKKRERISKGTQKVDVAKAGANIEKNPKKDGGRGQQAQQQSGGKGRKRDRDRFKPALTEAQQEELQK